MTGTITQILNDPMTLWSLTFITAVFVLGVLFLLLPLWVRGLKLAALRRQCIKATGAGLSDVERRSLILRILTSASWMAEPARQYEKQWRSAFIDRSGAAVGDIRLTDFITPETVLPRLAHRYLAGVLPGILVALGILGTFMGLVKGLPALAVKEDNPNLSNLVNIITQSLGLAFYTSIFGITFSIFFLVIDRLLTRYIESQVTALSESVSSHFPTLPIEEMQRLQFKLFEDMTDLLRHLATDLAANLSNVLAPAISGAIQNELGPAFGTIKESFESLSKLAGEQQTAALHSMADAIAKTMNSAVGTHLDQLAETVQGTVTSQQRLNATLEEFSQRLSASASGQVELIRQTDAAARSLGASLDRLEQIGGTLGKGAADILVAGKGLEASAKTALEAQREARAAQDELLKAMREQSDTISNAAREMESSWTTAVERALGAIHQIQEASRQLGEGIGDTLLKALESFDSAVAEIVSRFSGTLAQVDASISELPPVAASLKNGTEEFSKTVGTLNEGINSLEKSILGPFSASLQSALDAASRIKEETAAIEHLLGGASMVQKEFVSASQQLSMTAASFAGIRDEIDILNKAAANIIPLLNPVQQGLANLNSSLDGDLRVQFSAVKDVWQSIEPAITRLSSLPSELKEVHKVIDQLGIKISERLSEMSRQFNSNMLPPGSQQTPEQKKRPDRFLGIWGKK